MEEQLAEQIKQLPDKPGVYLMKDEMNEIIYVGKAKSLKKRVRSYFHKGSHNYKTAVMMEQIADFDYIVTDTEVESYILEANLIKKNQPKFNIRLKDDKTYPYIKVTINEDFPRIFKTRLVKKDGGRYFGPFASADAIYKTVDVLQDLFLLRRCKQDIDADNPEERPCLNYYIDKCVAPCTGNITQEQYGALVDQVCMFLTGRQEQLLKRVEDKMYQASAANNFEKAAHLRDSLQALQEISQQQKVMSDKNDDQDVIALEKSESGTVCVQLLLIRNGRLIGQEYFLMEGSEDEQLRNVMGSFLQQYYEQAPQLPEEILVNMDFAQKQLLADRLKQRKGKKIGINRPQRGDKKRLLELAARNARENLKKEEIRKKYNQQRTAAAVSSLQKQLDLDRRPRRIEGFDISNIQGTDPVAGLVVFEEGVPSKKDYRRFKIKTVSGPDDFAMMKEVIGRRYRRLLAENRKLPDLILIDGGKGQLNAAREVLRELELGKIEIIGLAKKEEEIFLPHKGEPVMIPHTSPALHLLQRVRDEAHRFAVNYHRKLRSRRLTHSMLDNIPGVGPKRRTALLQHFGSLEKIKNASIGSLKEVDGISSQTARKIRDYLRENTRAF